MRKLTICLLLGVYSVVSVRATTIKLGTADSYAILAGSTVTNTHSSVITGDLGVSPGGAFTGFPPGSVSGTMNEGNAAAAQAQTDLTTAYNVAAGLSCGINNELTGIDLGGLTLTPGVYCFDSSAQLTGKLTLNAQGDPNAFFVFQMGSTLTTASSSSVVFINGLQNNGDNVFWQVGSSATLGTDTELTGNILALTSITLNTRASLECGRALARNGAVTLDTNEVSTGEGCETLVRARTPEPGTLSLLPLGFCVIAFLRSKRR